MNYINLDAKIKAVALSEVGAGSLTEHWGCKWTSFLVLGLPETWIMLDEMMFDASLVHHLLKSTT